MRIKRIIKASGGPEAIAAGARARGTKLTAWSVYKWQSNGIPEKHWPLIVDLSGATIEDLFAANTELRSGQQEAAHG